MKQINFGWEIPTFSGINYTASGAPCYEKYDYSSSQKTALLCEDLGYDNLWIADHLILGDKGEIAECWTTLSALASVTKRIRLGPLVLCEAFRNPALVAKMVTTLDNITDGRVDYGVGAGYNSFEANSYGIPWLDRASERIKRTEEGIEIVKRMWTEDRPTYEGSFYRIKEVICLPKPVQKPHPPIWIAGQGDKMLRTVAKYANGWNWFSTTVEEHQKLMDRLKDSCNSIGRPYDEITISWEGLIVIAEDNSALKKKIDDIRRLNPLYPLSFEDRITPKYPPQFSWQSFIKGQPEPFDFRAHNLVGTPGEIIERIREYTDIGVEHFMLMFLDYPSTDGIELFADKVIPVFK
ncbi:LLM class flavin-dependent oxidoreductase [[Eubacterium] cellulosolvens]